MNLINVSIALFLVPGVVYGVLRALKRPQAARMITLGYELSSLIGIILAGTTRSVFAGAYILCFSKTPFLCLIPYVILYGLLAGFYRLKWSGFLWLYWLLSLGIGIFTRWLAPFVSMVGDIT